MFKHPLFRGRPKKAVSPNLHALSLPEVHQLLATYELTGFFLRTITHHDDGHISEGSARPQSGTVVRTILYSDSFTVKDLVTQTKKYREGSVVSNISLPSTPIYLYLESIAQAAIIVRWLMDSKPGSTQRFILTEEHLGHITHSRFWDTEKHCIVADPYGGHIVSVIETSPAEID